MAIEVTVVSVRQSAITADLLPPVVPRRNRVALDQLSRVFRERRPLAVMVGAGAEIAHSLIGAFLETVASEVDLLRLADPSREPIACIRGIVRSIGFETDGLDRADLQQILVMFLSYQKTHRRRTILHVESAHAASDWTLELLDRLVGEEFEKKSGLLVLLAGEQALTERLRNSGFSALQAGAVSTIRCAAFDLNETRAYINRYVEAEGRGPISDVFEFEAISRVHDISAGEPDTINQLISECLGNAGDEPVSPQLVDDAACSLRLVSTSIEDVVDEPARSGRGWLVARKAGEVIERRAIDSEKLVIGRDSRCDMRLTGASVSRQHAIILWLKDRARVVDLGSTNGTFVNDERVESGELGDSAFIRVGEYEIEFTTGE